MYRVTGRVLSTKKAFEWSFSSVDSSHIAPHAHGAHITSVRSSRLPDSHWFDRHQPFRDELLCRRCSRRLPTRHATPAIISYAVMRGKDCWVLLVTSPALGCVRACGRRNVLGAHFLRSERPALTSRMRGASVSGLRRSPRYAFWQNQDVSSAGCGQC
ncbi:hypothetical protein K439DRAFT_333172 [Ramaria rubella]|nr:hypothetical protein K439DRAFT_333172 [Ramaria rubella]